MFMATGVITDTDTGDDDIGDAAAMPVCGTRRLSAGYGVRRRTLRQCHFVSGHDEDIGDSNSNSKLNRNLVCVCVCVWAYVCIYGATNQKPTTTV